MISGFGRRLSEPIQSLAWAGQDVLPCLLIAGLAAMYCFFSAIVHMRLADAVLLN